MNKVFNINLGSTPFVIDDNAYEALANYINGLRLHFGNSEGCDEIIADIEARIAELFVDYLKNRQIVTLADVKRAISVMGIPTEIEGNTTEPTTAHSSKGNWTAGKRLFRNEEDKVVGGVCSGLAVYLGFSDPLWMRLAWAALAFFSGGFAILVYLLLMVIVPKAVTAADKLAMRGENVNVDNIARTVEQEFNNIGQRLSELGNEINDGLKGKKFNGGSYSSSARTGSFSGGGDTLVNIIKGLVKVIAVFVISIALLVLAAAWIGFLIAGIYAQPYMAFFIDSPTAGYMGATALMLALITPIIGLILMIIRIFYKNVKINSLAIWGLALTWLGSMLTLIVIGTTIMRQFSTSDTVSQTISLKKPTADRLSIDVKPVDYEEADIELGGMRLVSGRLISDDVQLDIEQSPDAEFHLIQKNIARGSNGTDARRAATEIEYSLIQTDSSLLFDPLLRLPKEGKCKWQKVRFTLQVPIGKKIQIKPEDNHYFRYFTDDVFLAKTESDKDDDWENDAYDIFRNKARTWRMTQHGLVCDSCTPEEMMQLSTQHSETDMPDEENTTDTENPDNGEVIVNDSVLNINAKNTKIELDKEGLSLKTKEKNNTVEIKIDEKGVKMKKNGKRVNPESE